MRFVSLVKGVLGKARLSVTQAVSTMATTDTSDNESTMENVVRTMRRLGLRIAKLESLTQVEATEFEVTLAGNGIMFELCHNYNGPVRYWVTTWMQLPDNGASPNTAPILVRDTSSTFKTLVLKSYVVGRAIIRVEPSSYDLDP